MNRTESFAKLRTILVKQRDELARVLCGDLSLLSGHDGDGDEWYEDGTTSSLIDDEGEVLEMIDNALERMRDGSYGSCEQCGRPIRLERLKVLPYASTCISCQRELEH